MKKLLAIVLAVTTPAVLALAAPWNEQPTLDVGEGCVEDCHEDYQSDVRDIVAELSDRVSNCPDLACVIDAFAWYEDALAAAEDDYASCVNQCPGGPYPPSPE